MSALLNLQRTVSDGLVLSTSMNRFAASSSSLSLKLPGLLLLAAVALLIESGPCAAGLAVASRRDDAGSGAARRLLPDNGLGDDDEMMDEEEDDDGSLVWPTLALPAPPPLSPSRYQQQQQHERHRGPFFEPEFANNVTVTAGQTVLLQCRVIDLADRVVSWVRQSDLAILASGGVSHTSDNRISASADDSLTDWELKITDAQPKDSGVYECQVNTEPKINWPVTVHVEAAVATIVGASELYVRTGSTISLTCIIQGSGAIPARALFWYHDDKHVVVDSPRGGISLETERTAAGMSSKLLLTRATVQDGGNYTCAPPGAQPANVTVHVLNGEHPAAMQRGNRSPTSGTSGRAAQCIGREIVWAIVGLAMGLQFRTGYCVTIA